RADRRGPRAPRPRHRHPQGGDRRRTGDLDRLCSRSPDWRLRAPQGRPGSRLLSRGVAEIGFAQSGGVTRLTHLYQRDPLRVLFPTPDAGDPALAVIVTTSGGLVAGDKLDIAVCLAPGRPCM